MISPIESFLRNLSSDTITNIFFGILILVFILGAWAFLSARKSNKKKSIEFAEYTPVLLTSLGILGTFTGIVSGLLNFDIDNIDTSISSLLGGMKTAFLTSVIGVTLSILLKVFYTVVSKKASEESKENALDIQSVVDNFYSQTEQLKEQTLSLKKQALHSESLVSNIESLTKSLGSDSDSSILGQIKLLRSDLSDNHKQFTHAVDLMVTNLSSISDLTKNNQTTFASFENKLWIKLQDFADMMSKSATEAVIDALKQVIQDFNNNLTEQFGENFKELNKAVIALIDWQENYKKQLNEMIALYSAGVQSLSVTETSVAKIEHSAQAIPTTMNNLSQIISTNQQQIENLESHLSTFAQLRDKAIEAVPEIQKQISSMLENTEKANVELITGLKDGGKQLSEDIVKVSATFSEKSTETATSLAKSFKESGDEFTQKVTQSADNLTATIQKHHEDIQKQMSVMLENTEKANVELITGLKDGGKQLGEDIVKVSATFSEKATETATSLAKSFKESGDEFTQKVTQSTDNLTASIQKNHQALLDSASVLEKTSTAMVDEQQRFLKQQSQISTQITDFISEWQRQFEQNTQQIQKQFAQSVESLIQSHIDESRRLMSRLEKESEVALSRTGESIDKQIKALDSALETELSRVIGDMGKALASISNQFTNDYSKLVEAMRKVTEKSRGF
ncbi:hypothetical protein A1D22_04630 [Pasteurellaceae bacterium LFhippo2]|nr:hypothetical protein [Pasteurellaceae bacterium LFhippo2]